MITKRQPLPPEPNGCTISRKGGKITLSTGDGFPLVSAEDNAEGRARLARVAKIYKAWR